MQSATLASSTPSRGRENRKLWEEEEARLRMEMERSKAMGRRKEAGSVKRTDWGGGNGPRRLLLLPALIASPTQFQPEKLLLAASGSPDSVSEGSVEVRFQAQ